MTESKALLLPGRALFSELDLQNGFFMSSELYDLSLCTCLDDLSQLATN